MNVKSILFVVLFSIIGLQSVYHVKGQTAKITVVSDHFDTRDTLELCVWRELISNLFKAPYEVIRPVISKNSMEFHLDSLKKDCFVSLFFSFQKSATRPYYGIYQGVIRVKAGDDVLIKLHPVLGKYRNTAGYDNGEPIFLYNWRPEFSGKGSEKMKIAYKTERYIQDIKIIPSKPKMSRVENAAFYFDYFVNKINAYKQELEEFRDSMEPKDYAMAQVDAYGSLYKFLVEVILRNTYYSDELEKMQQKATLEKIFELIRPDLINSELLAKSPDYVGFLKTYFEAIMFIERPKEGLSRIISLLDEHINNTQLKERVLTYTLMDDFYKKPQQELYDYAMSNVSDSYALSQLESLKLFLKGNKEFDFSLPNEKGEYHKLTDYKGKVVLIDFWYMGCLPCRAYIQDVVKPLVAKYTGDADVEFILINLDKEAVFKRVVDQGVVPKEIVNLNTEDLQFSHPLIKKIGINAYPYPMLFSKDGEVVSAGNELRSLDAVVKKIEQARE